jgi:putative transposase
MQAAAPQSLHESFNGKLRDERLNGEIFYSRGAIVVIDQWRNQYNTIRPHSSLNYRSPAPQTSTARLPQLDRNYPMQ